MAEPSFSLIESDPAIFSTLLEELGVRGLEVNELFSLDRALLQSLDPLALIFLFKWVDTSGSLATAAGATAEMGKPKHDAAFYFAHQVINNACATMAILNAVLNIDRSKITTNGAAAKSRSAAPAIILGDELESFRDFSLALDPTSRGLAVTNSEKIREAHNSFARSDPFEHTRDLDDDRDKEDAYHFITYIPIDGELYELDGLKDHPISHGTTESSWTDRAKAVIEARIASYGEGELNFNLMGICRDQVTVLKSKLESLQAIQGSAAGGDTRTDLAGDTSTEMYHIQEQLQEELAKKQRWAFDNTLRRHNHLGLVHALLVAMAKEGKLAGAIEESRKLMTDRKEKARQRAKLAGQA